MKINPVKIHAKKKNKPFKALATYAITLPERLLFSLTSVASGIFDTSSEVLLPPWLRKSTSYRVTLGLMHRFINQNIVGLMDSTEPLSDQYLHRKTAGTVLEAAGLALFRFSPVWFFAIISDAAGGSRVYLDHLTKHLKANGILAEDHSHLEIKDLLEAIQNSSDVTAGMMDMPPLSMEEAQATAQQILGSYAMTGEKASQLLPSTEDIWKSIQSLSSKGVSIESIIGIMTVNAAKATVNATANATAEVIDQHIINSYRDTLKQLDHEGPSQYIGRKMSPYMSASLNHFSPSKTTWTEKGLEKAIAFQTWVQSKVQPVQNVKKAEPRGKKLGR